MKLKDLISDLENREVEEVNVLGECNIWVARCSLATLEEVSDICYLAEVDAEAYDFFGLTYVRIEDEEDYIESKISEVMYLEGGN